MKRRWLSCVAIFVFAIGIAARFTSDVRAQAPPAFDVVSIKRNAGGPGMQMRMAPGNMSALNVPVRQLIRQAYGLQDFQIVGGPDWVGTDRFNVEARFDPAAPAGDLQGPPRIQAMLKTLLADRFKLAAHTETREMPILALVMARDDRRLGPQLKPSSVDCAALQKQFAAGRQGGGPPLDGRGGPPPPGTPFSLGERPQCGGRGGFGQMIAGGILMSQFVTQLSQLTSRIVVDRSGLTGGYDIDLKWTPTPDQLPQGPPPPGFEPPPIDPNGPSLFTALEEQLGLKLETQRGPVDVLVIDRIEQPTEN
jgi:uncharacterized protein (TIGR03435 family)